MNGARYFMWRDDYQPPQPRNPKLLTLFNLSCVKCDSVNSKIIGVFDDDSVAMAHRQMTRSR